MEWEGNCFLVEKDGKQKGSKEFNQEEEATLHAPFSQGVAKLEMLGQLLQLKYKKEEQE